MWKMRQTFNSAPYVPGISVSFGFDEYLYRTSLHLYLQHSINVGFWHN